MATQQIILLIINIIGGIAVIGSYIYGFKSGQGGANALWGGVPANIRPIYFVSMLISALGYFAFAYYLLFHIKPADITIGTSIGYWLFYIIFLGILIPSAFWMPLTNAYVANPVTGLWIWIRIVLAAVGIASIMLVWALATIQPQIHDLPFWLAIAGSAYFALHTAILDAVIWAALFK